MIVNPAPRTSAQAPSVPTPPNTPVFRPDVIFLTIAHVLRSALISPRRRTIAAEDASLLSPAALSNHWPVNAPSTPPCVAQPTCAPEHGNPRRDCPTADAKPDLTPSRSALPPRTRTQIAQAGNASPDSPPQRKAQTGDLA